MPGHCHTRCCTCHAKLSQQTWIWCSKMQPLSGNQRPDLLTALMNMSLVLRLPRKMHLCRSSSNVPRLPSFLEMLQNPHVLLTLNGKVHNPVRLPRETTLQSPKVVRASDAFHILTAKCASRHNRVHFFDISTSKSGPELRCLYILTWKCASCHNGMQFFISHLASWLRTRRFSKPTFQPTGATNHWKNTVFRDFPTFSRTWIFFLLRLSLFELLSSSLLFSSLLFSSLLFSSLLLSSLLFSSLTLPIAAFHLSILSEVWLLNFLRWIGIQPLTVMHTWVGHWWKVGDHVLLASGGKLEAQDSAKLQPKSTCFKISRESTLSACVDHQWTSIVMNLWTTLDN